MVPISENESRDLIEEEKEKIREVINAGGKFIKTVIEEKNKTTMVSKLKPVDEKPTGTRIIQTKDSITLQKL